MGPSFVVVPNVFREHGTQVPLAYDQYVAGEFGSEGSDEPFGKAVRSWATRRYPDHADAHIGQDGVEGCCELAGPVADEDPKGHCCIKAKGVLAVPQSGDAGPSGTLENRNKPGI